MGVGGTQVARAHAFALTDRTVGESSQLWSLASSPRVVGDRDVRPVGLQFSRRRCAIPFGPHDQSPAEPGEIRVLDHSGQSERAPRFIVFSHRPELVEGSPGTPSPQTRPGRRPVRPAVKASSWLMAQRTGTGWPAATTYWVRAHQHGRTGRTGSRALPSRRRSQHRSSSRRATKPSAQAEPHACATTFNSSAKDASECPATSLSTYGSTAAIPP